MTVGIERDGYGRVFRRTHTGQNDVWYGYGSGDDQASYTATVTAGALTLTDQMQSLPGGVTLSRKTAGGQTRYTLPNMHGDTAAIVDPAGVKQGTTYKWDPDGMPVAGTTQPDLLNGGFENGWLAQHFRPVDTTDPAMPIIEMGARPYLPSIARFLTVDPVEGGNDNDYNYPSDPVNQRDLTGAWCVKKNKKGGCVGAGATGTLMVLSTSVGAGVANFWSGVVYGAAAGASVQPYGDSLRSNVALKGVSDTNFSDANQEMTNFCAALVTPEGAGVSGTISIAPNIFGVSPGRQSVQQQALQRQIAQPGGLTNKVPFGAVGFVVLVVYCSARVDD